MSALRMRAAHSHWGAGFGRDDCGSGGLSIPLRAVAALILSVLVCGNPPAYGAAKCVTIDKTIRCAPVDEPAGIDRCVQVKDKTVCSSIEHQHGQAKEERARIGARAEADKRDKENAERVRRDMAQCQGAALAEVHGLYSCLLRRGYK